VSIRIQVDRRTTFSLKDPEPYAILCGDREYSELPRDVRRPRKAAEVTVWAASNHEAEVAFEEWQRHLDAGRTGRPRE
jgi:hypothetical protein